MIQNTSETRETLGRYTLPQLESMVEAIVQNSNTEGSSDKTVLKDSDALGFLINNGGTL